MASIAKRADGKWRARYRDEAGKQHARHFERKVDAQRWLDEVTAAVVTGQYVDPRLAESPSGSTPRVAGSPGHRPTSGPTSRRCCAATPTRRSATGSSSTILPSRGPGVGPAAGHVRQRSNGRRWRRRPSASSTASSSVDHAGGGARPEDRREPVRGDAAPDEGAEAGRAARRPSRSTRCARRCPPELQALVTFAAGTGHASGRGASGSRSTGSTSCAARCASTGSSSRVPAGGPSSARPRRRRASAPSRCRRSSSTRWPRTWRATRPGEHGLVFTARGEPITRQAFGHVWRPVARGGRASERGQACTRCGTTTRRC